MSESAMDPRTIERGIAAIVAGGVGDALGWPNEPRSGRISRNGHYSPEAGLRFQAWHRLGGNRRSAPYVEPIEPGSYSDDTQLVCCVARSRLAGPQWLAVFQHVELPGWLLYERGGGATVKRAAQAWARGRAPWGGSGRAGQREAAQYFTAGGNGAAMRILPHCLVWVDSEAFTSVGTDILADSLTTHGHPRALIGALAYGYACWAALRSTTTLEYGGLINVVQEAVGSWGQLVPQVFPNGWIDGFEKHCHTRFEDVWADTVREFGELLQRASDAIRLGAMAIDQNVLASLGCQDPKTYGAGTITAAGTIFLASRAAANPTAGLLEAAFLPHADSDTLASMTGSLLGAILGRGWVASLARQLQDVAYLERLAMRLLTQTNLSLKPHSAARSPRLKPARRKLLDRAHQQLMDADSDDMTVELPDGRKARMIGRDELLNHTGQPSHARWILRTDDGQTLHPVHFLAATSREQTPGTSRAAGTSADAIVNESPRNVPNPVRARSDTGLGHTRVTRIATKLYVRDLSTSRAFYQELLGLHPSRETPALVNFEEALTLMAYPADVPFRRTPPVPATTQVVFIELTPIGPVFDAIRHREPDLLLSQLHHHGDRQWFRCCDPDSHIVEVYETHN